jgi:hypothetical protein
MHAAYRARCLIQAGREAPADPALPLPTLTRATATSSKELFFSGRSTRRPATDTLAPAPTPASDLQPPSDRHASLDRGPRLVPLHRHAAMPLPAGDRLAGSTAPQARPSAYASPPANRKRARRAAMPPSAGDRPVSDLLPDRHALLEERPVACAFAQAHGDASLGRRQAGKRPSARPTRPARGKARGMCFAQARGDASLGRRQAASDLPPDRHAPHEERPVACAVAQARGDASLGRRRRRTRTPQMSSKKFVEIVAAMCQDHQTHSRYSLCAYTCSLCK